METSYEAQMVCVLGITAITTQSQAGCRAEARDLYGGTNQALTGQAFREGRNSNNMEGSLMRHDSRFEWS
jgi:hypothetical protein